MLFRYVYFIICMGASLDHVKDIHKLNYLMALLILIIINQLIQLKVADLLKNNYEYLIYYA
jgi:hypothetical protein